MMLDNLTRALAITLIGMGLVFLSIILLAAVTEGLVRLAGWKRLQPDLSEGEPAERETSSEHQRRKRAAAAAVAYALAQQADASEPHEFPLPPAALVSAWQAVLRSRMLNKRGKTR